MSKKKSLSYFIIHRTDSIKWYEPRDNKKGLFWVQTTVESSWWLVFDPVYTQNPCVALEQGYQYCTHRRPFLQHPQCRQALQHCSCAANHSQADAIGCIYKGNELWVYVHTLFHCAIIVQRSDLRPGTTSDKTRSRIINCNSPPVLRPLIHLGSQHSL